MFKSLFENAPKIIEAAKSPLGIVALVVLALSVLAGIFFRSAPVEIQAAVFAALFVGFGLFVLSVFRMDGRITPENGPQIPATEAQESPLHEKARATIHLRVSEEILSTSMKFGILHVRDGKDEVEDKGPLLNREMNFQEIDRRGTLQTSIKYSKTLGFQFKCFADYKGMPFDKAKEILERHGYLKITAGEGKQNRLWFILPEYSTCITVDKIENNFFYPA